ncbi:hypothetical protein Ga0609869_001854 [Rhodovulum iodosum]|uniref:Hedgehog/Intein (Hint) domain-containing protein n=1 Tax=Rhodovulum iodosum TaxID=68291 RepID=A0ABV3XT36_9RHOB|nr:Hint domain-containing protein [Rhodovulum robiginosum]
MATIELFVTGDQIGTFSSYSVSGQSNGTKLFLYNALALGTSNDVFRIVVEDVDPGDSYFNAGHKVTIYSYPANDEVFSVLDADDTSFNGRASSNEHQVLTDGTGGGLVIDLDGINESTLKYGPGNVDPLSEVFEFTSLPPTPPGVPCFCLGTLIETAAGPLPVECLREGDLVMTADHGPQPIRWIGRRRIAGRGTFAPIRIAAGALGNHRTLTVSPQHRLLVDDWRAEMFFGQAQVLVAAKHLINGTTIRPAEMPEVTYLHFAFDRHEIVYAEGIPTESLYLGAMTLSGVDRAAREELMALFPELADVAAGPGPTARTCLRGWEGQLLAPSSTTGVLSSAA